MKKVFAAVIMMTLLFSPVGNAIFQDQPTTVEAKGYKSGKKSFNMNGNTNKSNSNSLFQNNKSNSSNNKATSANRGGGFLSGGLMKGLMLGGLAGLLFGGLLGNLGVLGSLLGFAVNVLAIFILFSIIRKIFNLIKKKKQEETNPWSR